MSEKDKALELVEKFIEPTKVPNIKKVWVEDKDAAKQCALICVEEKINLLKSILDKSIEVHQSLSTPTKICIDILNPILKELKQVKQEINKL